MQEGLIFKVMHSKLSRRSLLRGAALWAAAFPLGRGVKAFAEEPIKIGTLLSHTGALAAYGPPINNGAKLAAAQINEAGGPMGRQIKLINRDSRTDPTAAVDAARKLVNIDKVPAFIGALSSSVTMAVASVSVASRVVQISPASTSPQLTALEDDDFLFRTCPSDTLQGKVTGRLAWQQGFRRVSTIYVNNDYGEGLSINFKKSFEAQGGRVLEAVPYEKGKASYRGELERASREKPDALAVFGYPENGTTIIRQSIELGLTRKFLLADGMKAPEIIENVGARYLEGTYGTAPGSKKTNASELFLSAYRANFGEPPPKPFISNCYDAMAVIALAMHRAKKATGPAIRDSLRAVANPPGVEIFPGEFKKAFSLLDEGKEINYQGAAGDIDFDDRGDVVTPIEVWKIEGGKIVSVRAEEV